MLERPKITLNSWNGIRPLRMTVVCGLQKDVTFSRFWHVTWFKNFNVTKQISHKLQCDHTCVQTINCDIIEKSPGFPKSIAILERTIIQLSEEFNIHNSPHSYMMFHLFPFLQDVKLDSLLNPKPMLVIRSYHYCILHKQNIWLGRIASVVWVFFWAS
jgi:hypothetical protein